MLGFPHDQGCIWMIHRKTARLVFHGSWPNLSTRDRKPSNYQPGSGPRFPPLGRRTFPSPGGGLCFHWFHRNCSAVAWHWIGFLISSTFFYKSSLAVFRIRKFLGLPCLLVQVTDPDLSLFSLKCCADVCQNSIINQILNIKDKKQVGSGDAPPDPL